jgi:hypothetical protein
LGLPQLILSQFAKLQEKRQNKENSGTKKNKTKEKNVTSSESSDVGEVESGTEQMTVKETV